MRYLYFLLLCTLIHSFETIAAANEFPYINTNQRVLNLYGRNLQRGGPNCWNIALYAAGIVDGVRHTDALEFSHLTSTYCQEISEQETKAGDIAALRRVDKGGRLVHGPYGFEIHAYVLVDTFNGFTKNGVGKSYGYEIQSVEDILEIYEKINKNDCRILGIPNDYCRLTSSFFRCTKPLPIQSFELTHIASQVGALEQRLHEFYTSPITAVDPNTLKNEVRTQAQELQWQLQRLKNLQKSLAEPTLIEIETLEHALANLQVFQF